MQCQYAVQRAGALTDSPGVPTGSPEGARDDRPVAGFVGTCAAAREPLPGAVASGGRSSGSGVVDGVGLGGGSVGVGGGSVGVGGVVVGSGVGVGVLEGGVGDSLGVGVGVGVGVGDEVGVGGIVIGGAVGPIGGRPPGGAVDQIDAVEPPRTWVVPPVAPRNPEVPPSVTLVDTPVDPVPSVSSSAGPPAR